MIQTGPSSEGHFHPGPSAPTSPRNCRASPMPPTGEARSKSHPVRAPWFPTPCATCASSGKLPVLWAGCVGGSGLEFTGSNELERRKGRDATQQGETDMEWVRRHRKFCCRGFPAPSMCFGRNQTDCAFPDAGRVPLSPQQSRSREAVPCFQRCSKTRWAMGRWSSSDPKNQHEAGCLPPPQHSHSRPKTQRKKRSPQAGSSRDCGTGQERCRVWCLLEYLNSLEYTTTLQTWNRRVKCSSLRTPLPPVP